MKVLALTCLILGSTICSALESGFVHLLQQQMLQRMKGEGLAFKTADTAKPVRTAKGNFRIEKYNLVILPDGSYQYKVTEVCSKSTSVNVYDVRTSGAPIDMKDLTLFACKSRFRGQDLNVTMGGVVTIATRNMFESKMMDFKAAYPLLAYEENPQLTATPPILFGSVGTSALESHESMLTFMNPSQMMDCDASGKCSPIPEAFGAVVEIFD